MTDKMHTMSERMRISMDQYISKLLKERNMSYQTVSRQMQILFFAPDICK